jgi:hypothetical protein
MGRCRLIVISALLTLVAAAAQAQQLKWSQAEGYAVLQNNGTKWSQDQAYAVLSNRIVAQSQGQAYAVLCTSTAPGCVTLTENLRQRTLVKPMQSINTDLIPAKVELTIVEWNQIITCLMDHPYKLVATLIGKIIDQAKTALPPAPAPQAYGELDAAAPENGHVPN